jgi:rubrerythrin
MSRYIVCPECEHQVIDEEVLKCPTCTASDYEDETQEDDLTDTQGS